MMTVDGLRTLRLFFKFGLLVSLPLTGYLWALDGVSPWAIGMSAVSAVMAIGAEGLASVAESRVMRITTAVNAEEKDFAAQAASRDERIRQMDRIVETLSNQNHDLRGKLVSANGEMQRLQEESAHLGLDGFDGDAAAGGPEQGGGAEITPLIIPRL